MAGDAAQQTIPWWAIGAAGGGLLVLAALIVLALNRGVGQPATVSPTPAPVVALIVSPTATANLPRQFGGIAAPVLLAPAARATIPSLDSPVTFTWQPIDDPSASYNLAFQYSNDGSYWQKPEFVYGIIGTSYTRRDRFLEYPNLRWQVWATTYRGEGPPSDWRRLLLPPPTTPTIGGG